MTTLLVAEHDNKTLKDATNKASPQPRRSAASARAGRRQRLPAAAEAAAKLDGVEKVLVADAAPMSTCSPSRWLR